MSEIGDGLEQPPVQLRINFQRPTTECCITLSLIGLIVNVSSSDDVIAAAYLIDAGISVELDAIHGLRFSVKDLSLLANLPERVSIRSSDGLAALLEIVKHPPKRETPVSVSLDDKTQLNLSWHDGIRRFDEPLPLAFSPALIASALPFVAANDTWEKIQVASKLPIVVGRARVNLDGYIEIHVSAPQKIEATKLPGLFRVDATHYGIALEQAVWIDKTPGFYWVGPKPIGDASPTLLAENSPQLSEQSRDDLRKLVDGLAKYRTRAIVSTSDEGRRVLALAGVESLLAYPLLVICAPHAIWSWERIASIFSRQTSVVNNSTDIQIHTYEELRHNPRISSPSTIIFDDLDRALFNDSSVLNTLKRFNGLIDVIRISCSENFPENQAEQVRLMSVIRPVEFNPEIAVALRYPVAPERKLSEHVEIYTIRQNIDENKNQMSRSTVEILDVSSKLIDLFNEIKISALQDRKKITSLMEATSNGSALAMSPKIARVIELARMAQKSGSSLAVVTRYSRTATLLKALLRPLTTFELESDGLQFKGVTIVRMDLGSWDLRDFDEVVFIDYPKSTTEIDDMVGKVNSERGPTKVTLLHLADCIDDKLSLLATGKYETAGATKSIEQLSETELRWMLQF